MKRYFLIITLLLSSLFAVKAQDGQPVDENQKQERIKALYVAFITDKLQLTADEAQKFWPVHTQFTNELKTVKQDLPELDKQQTVLNIKKKYQENFNRILGSNRCERFFHMDGEFKRKLLERMRKQNANSPRPRMKRGV